MIHKKVICLRKQAKQYLMKMSKSFFHLDKLVGKFSLYFLLRYVKVKTLSAIIWDFQIWQLKVLPVFVCQVVYCCNILIMMLKVRIIIEKTAPLMKNTFTSITE